ncbi:MAG: hypothetical protein H7836_17300 [Magnetococcus sp. YQC-3]
MQRIPYYRKKVTRYAKGVARRAGSAALSAAKARYGSSLQNANWANIAKDVALLKEVINSEKKRFRYASSAQQAVSQVSGNASGHWVFDMTPTPVQGASLSQRNGASVKLHSTYAKFQFYQQGSATGPIRLRMYAILVKGDPAPLATVTNEFLAPNQWIFNQNTVLIRDYNSQRNPDFYGDYKVLGTKNMTIRPDSFSGQTQIRDMVMKLKYNRGKGHHLRWDGDTNTLSGGQLVLLCVADSGNQSGATASTLNGIPIVGTLTGCVFNYDIQHYYYDN